MKVTRCDRCGKIIEDPATVTVKENEKQGIGRSFDLCQTCYKELMEHFLGQEE